MGGTGKRRPQSDFVTLGDGEMHRRGQFGFSSFFSDLDRKNLEQEETDVWKKRRRNIFYGVLKGASQMQPSDVRRRRGGKSPIYHHHP